MSGLTTSITEIAGDFGISRSRQKVSKGAIVKHTYKTDDMRRPRTVTACVVALCGDNVRVMDLRCLTYLPMTSSVQLVTDEEELGRLQKQFAEVMHSKRAEIALAPPIESDWAGYGGIGAPQRCDIPYVLRDRKHAAWPSPALMENVSQPSSLRVLQRDLSNRSPSFIDAERQKLRRQPDVQAALGMVA